MSEARLLISAEIGDAPAGSLAEASATAVTRFHSALLVSAGTPSMVLGLVGALVPVLPTTPFLLLAGEGLPPALKISMLVRVVGMSLAAQTQPSY